jgi:DNA-binding transcriptional regulator YiaG
MKTIREKELPILLRKLRGETSMEEFGRPYAASRQLVYQWEVGRSRPTPAVLEQMGIEVIYIAKI